MCIRTFYLTFLADKKSQRYFDDDCFRAISVRLLMRVKKQLSSGSMDRRISYIINLLKSDLRRQWTVNEMAQLVKLSPAHLHRLFKEQIGSSPIHYLRELRLMRARWLLENSYGKIEDIRVEVGMNDPSHFTQDFKAKYGVSPSAYRRQRIEVISMENDPVMAPRIY